MISDFAAAVAFLTRLPVGRWVVFGPKEVARSARWFPLVGLLLGGIYTGALTLFQQVFPPFLAAVLLAGVDAWLTGAMHLDAVADTADGFGGGVTREDVLRIMRDHAIGSYGAVTLALVLALKIGTITALLDAHRAIAAVLLAPVLGRWSAVLLSATQLYARPPEDDLPRSVGSPSRLIGRGEAIIATLTTVAIAAAADRWRGPAACALVAGGVAWWAWRCRRRIGGITGDTLGAGIEIAECLVLLFFTAPL